MVMAMNDNKGWKRRLKEIEMDMDERTVTTTKGDRLQGRTIDVQTTRQR